MLDAILSPQWDLRYFSFDPQWGEGSQMASMRNGSGDEYSIVFCPAGAFIRGFDHESDLSPWGFEPMAVVSGLTDGVPAALADQVTEPAFTAEGVPQVTVCLWREVDAEAWSFGRPRDPELRIHDGGAEWLFGELDGRAATYVNFASEYFEQTIATSDVEDVLANAPLTAELVLRLNPEADPTEILDETERMGYPVDRSLAPDTTAAGPGSRSQTSGRSRGNVFTRFFRRG